MPHSWPEATSFTSSLKRFSVDSLPSCTTTLSRIRRTLAPRSTDPSVTRQPATLPTLEMLNTSRIRALPSMVSRSVGGSCGFLVGANVEADDGGVEAFRQRHVGFANAADPGVQDARRHLVGAEL